MPPLPKFPAPSQPGGASASMYPAGATPSYWTSSPRSMNARRASTGAGGRGEWLAGRRRDVAGGCVVVGLARRRGTCANDPSTCRRGADRDRARHAGGCRAWPAGRERRCWRALPDAAPAQPTPTASAPMEATATPPADAAAADKRARKAAATHCKCSKNVRARKPRRANSARPNRQRNRRASRPSPPARAKQCWCRHPPRLQPRSGPAFGNCARPAATSSARTSPRSRMPQTRTCRRRHLHPAARDRTTTAERQSVAGGRASAMQGPVTCM